jgi:AAT family amino acid transporter
MEQHSKQLGTWNLVMLALGTVVGGSFFLGTAVSLRNAGPGTLIAFAVGGLITYLILMALSEMTVARPTHGSFRQYAETAFGPMASFVVGWLYWAGLVLALSSEGIAAATFARLWLPGVPV